MSDLTPLGDLEDSDIDVCMVDEDDSAPFLQQKPHDSLICDVNYRPSESGDNFKTEECKESRGVEKNKEPLAPSLANAVSLDASNSGCDANANPCGASVDLDSSLDLCRLVSSPLSTRPTSPESDSQNYERQINLPGLQTLNDEKHLPSDNEMTTFCTSQRYDEDSEKVTESNVGLDDDCADNYDDDEIDDNEDISENVTNRFYFESDHLAFKHNKDYKLLLKTLVVLEAQRITAINDLQDLCKWKETALKDPISFVESLQSKSPPQLPERQSIAALPPIDWMQYLTASSSIKLPAGILANTRRSFRTKGDLTPTESQTKPEMICQEDSDSIDSESFQVKEKITRSRLVDDKTVTFNRLWTTEEQERLEKLLTVFPPEDIEARRWEKIAKALGNRTPKQVSSRVQKYFIKLARAGLPIPGRAPHMHSQKKSRVNPVSFRNSTFFPSWKPSVYMNEDDDDTSSVTTTHSDDTPYVSDEDMFTSDVKRTAAYKELVDLKKYRRKLEEDVAPNSGFMCDACGQDPIKGMRWHCADCSGDVSVDICEQCMERNPEGRPKLHPSWHRMASFEETTSFVDGDYLAFEVQHGGKYNYLDPNFIPKTR